MPRPELLETFANPCANRDYEIQMDCDEFTSLCPVGGVESDASDLHLLEGGAPDFGTIRITYVPGDVCVELKSLKLYIWSFRDKGRFHEAVTNEVLDDLVKATKPRFMRLTARFFVRGGIFTTVVAEHRKKGWQAPARIELAPGPAEGSSTYKGEE